MSAFSTVSSASTLPPQTPQTSTPASTTPCPVSPISDTFDRDVSSSSPTEPMFTPPESLRKYSTALKKMMQRGMSAAVADMNDDTRDIERQFDVEFGYDDEDPIARHVRLHLSPGQKVAVPKVIRPGAQGPSQGVHRAEVVQGQDDRMEGLGDSVREASHDEEQQKDAQMVDMLVETQDHQTKHPVQVAPFRPGLIQFHRHHSSSSSSANSPMGSSSRGPIPSFSRTNSDPSAEGAVTPYQFDYSSYDYSTPGSAGSQFSEVSFDAIKPEDIQSMYGRGDEDSMSSAYQPRNPFFEGFSSSSSSYRQSADQIRSTTPPPFDRFSVLSTDSSASTITSATQATFTHAIYAKPVIQQRPGRPGIGLRQKSITSTTQNRTQPYPASVEMRAKDRSNSGSGGDTSKLISAMTPIAISTPPEQSDTEDLGWLNNRTISETMVAQAGIRCQRGRNVTRAGARW